MTDTELLETLVEWVVQQIDFELTETRKTALAAFQTGDDRTIKISALLNPHDRFLDALSYLGGARRLAKTSPVVGFTTVKEAINALSDVHPRGKALWEEVAVIVQENFEIST